MGKRDYPNGSFIACIPHQIEANWDGEWGPRVAGFPLNIVYMFLLPAKMRLCVFDERGNRFGSDI